MATFLTKVWGIDEPCGPLQFGEAGWRERARRLLTGGPHRVVMVGTMGEQTPEHWRGRILGMMEPTTEPVMSLDFPLSTRTADFTGETYKWPFALHNRRAWKFEEPLTLLTDLTDQKFHMDAAAGIVPINDDLAHKIMELAHVEIELLRSVVTAQDRVSGETGTSRRNSPVPTTTRRGVMHMRRARAETYCFRIAGGEGSYFKVGWAFEHTLRRRQFNRAALPALGGLRYVPLWCEAWDTAKLAYRMEQAVLRSLDACRHPDNHEVVKASETVMLSAWREAKQRILAGVVR